MPLELIRQDITKMQVDAIVNTTNRAMQGKSGVDGAVHKAAGKALEEACAALAPMEKGKAVLTEGYGLPCKYIIHTCGPVWQGGESGEEQLLKDCYRTCLRLAAEQQLETVAFPLIASGAYGYPKDKVLSLAVREITDFLLTQEMTVYLCVFDRTSYDLSKKLRKDVESFIDDIYADEKTCIEGNARPKEMELCSRYEAIPCASKFEIPGSLSGLIAHMDKSFGEMLFELIDKKGMDDVACYKKANVSRKTFSKIKCDKHYRPSKETAVAFAIALELNLEETEAFLRTAGMSLSHSVLFDVIIEYFITKGNYDVFQINEMLFHYDQPCLGC